MEQVLFFYAACASVKEFEKEFEQACIALGFCVYLSLRATYTVVPRQLQTSLHCSRLLRIFVAARHIYCCASVMKIEQVHFHYSRLLRIFAPKTVCIWHRNRRFRREQGTSARPRWRGGIIYSIQYARCSRLTVMLRLRPRRWRT